MLKSVQKRMTKEEFRHISKVANIEDLWTRMDNIIDELKKTDWLDIGEKKVGRPKSIEVLGALP
jgi:hypothetical protein